MLINIIALGAVSSLFIHSTSTNFSQYGSTYGIKQAIFYGVSLVALFIIANIDLVFWRKIRWFLYGFIFILLVGLFVAPDSIAPEINHAVSWYKVPLLGTFQPSEFMKFALLLVIAVVIEKHNASTQIQTITTDMLLLGKIALVSLPVMLVVYKQPDTGMAILYASMIAPMILLSGIQKKLLLFFAAIPTLALATIITIYFKFNDFYQEKILGALSGHQISRINGWLHPFEYLDSSYQTRNGLLAIGSGGFNGKGYMGNDVYIPEKHTDFIFASIAEETGFIGGSIVIVLLFALIYRIVMITMNANDLFSSLIGAGIVGLLAFQTFQNIGMTMGVLPVTGVTLPFLSYGGSSLLSNIMLIGLVCLIKQSYGDYMFKSNELD